MKGKEKMNVRELAMEISLTSLGSSQTLPRPHLRTLEASLFWSLSETIAGVLPPSWFFWQLLWAERLSFCGTQVFIYRSTFAVLEFRPRVSSYDWAL